MTNKQKKLNWCITKEKLLIFLYTKHLPVKKLTKILNCSSGTLYYKIKKLNLKGVGSGNTRNFLLNPFIRNTSDRDYWLGFILADGHIGKGSIALFSNRKETSDQFNMFCFNQCKIYKTHYISKGNIGTIYRTILISKRIQEWFSNYFNIPKDKRYTLNPNLNINWDIIRGYFDGDGNAHKSGGLTITSGSKVWINRIKEFFEVEGIFSTIKEYKTYSKISIWRKNELKKAVNKLYKNKSFFLRYKYERFEPYMSNHIMKTQ